MNNPFYLLISLILALFLISPDTSYCQDTDQRIIEELKYKHREKVRDSYLPNKYNNQRTSPATKYISNGTSRTATVPSTIFTIQVNVDSSGLNIIGDAANEPSIAVNPLNPDEIAIGWRQFDNVSSNFRQAGWSYTTDAGQTWTFPGAIEAGIFRSDPVLDYDMNGNFYYNSLTSDTALNFSCKVFKSSDGGANWNAGTDAKGGDKQWMTIDRTTGVGTGNIYSFWTYTWTSCIPGFFTRSTNGGLSYESCIEVDGFPYWGTMAVGNAGELYIAGVQNGFDSLQLVRSLNAKVPGSTIAWEPPNFIYMEGNLNSGINLNPGGLRGQVNIDVDRSNGPGRDNIYIVAPLTPLFNNDPSDVMFCKSTNGGLNWTYPEVINDDNSYSNTQWFATMSVAPNGRIDVIWLDTRDDPNDMLSALYYSYSTDEGITWSVNEKLSPSFNSLLGHPNQNKMGDYFDMVSHNNGAHLAWSNTLNGEQDLYYSLIVPPVVIGIDESVAETNFTLVPNPVSTSLSILSNSFSLILIYNSLGQIVYETNQSDNLSKLVKVDVSNWNNGFYYVKSGNTVKKFVKVD